MAAALVLPLAGAPWRPLAAQPVIQPLPDPAAERLAEALRTLSRDPQSLEALIAAGDASLRLDEIEAAEGFFNRAELIVPTDGRVRAGKATILLRRNRPADALVLYDEAEQLGAPMAVYAADRGLAYDLVGDPARAQAAYAVALSFGPDDVVSRRLAISQAIAGDRAASEATLLPLLQRQDLAAFRARAFALAILGETDEAVSIAETMLAPRIASRLAPYLRYLSRLTPAQQAAAANLGQFPPAEEIGRPNAPAVAPPAAPLPAPTPQAAGRGSDDRLVPQGEPLGPPASVPPQAAASAPSGELPPIDGGPAPVMTPASTLDRAPLAAVPPAAQPEGAVTPTASEQIQPVAPSPYAPASLPAAVAPEPQPAPQPEIDLRTAFADLAQAPRPAPTRAGAVDITTIEPRREVRHPPAPPPPPPPAHPSRHWVQVATGRDAAALGFDWRRIRRGSGGVLDKAKPHLAPWGDRTRLLAGPFDSADEAQEMVGTLAKEGVSAFRFTSPAGEEVRPLD